MKFVLSCIPIVHTPRHLRGYVRLRAPLPQSRSALIRRLSLAMAAAELLGSSSYFNFQALAAARSCETSASENGTLYANYVRAGECGSQRGIHFATFGARAEAAPRRGCWELLCLDDQLHGVPFTANVVGTALVVPFQEPLNPMLPSLPPAGIVPL